MTTFRNSTQDGTKFSYQCQRFLPMILESLHQLKLREFAQIKIVLVLYDMDIYQKISMPNYEKLKTMLRRCIDQKTLTPGTGEWKQEQWSIETGAVIKNQKGASCVEGGTITCYQCSQGDRYSFRHETQDRAQKQEHTDPTPSEPNELRIEVCRGREVSEAKATMGPFFDTCRCQLRRTCTRTLCEYWHPPECKFYRAKTGCESGDKYMFLHHRVCEQSNQKPKESYFPKRRESDDKNAVAIVKCASQLGCVSQDSDALAFSK